MASSSESLGHQDANKASSPERLKDQEAMGCDNKRKRNPSEEAGNAEEFKHPNPCMTKKRVLDKDGKGCKGCTCTKTQCLKLYCDCFAAGIFCSQSHPCSCQGCLNTPAHEDAVVESKKHIKSPNPSAFLPKIALQSNDASNDVTPSSSKRGCNCKKSMCRKNYCECFKANLGCSNACGCLRCKNAYGTKEDDDLAGAPLDTTSIQVPPAPANDPPHEHQQLLSPNNEDHATAEHEANIIPTPPAQSPSQNIGQSHHTFVGFQRMVPCMQQHPDLSHRPSMLAGSGHPTMLVI